MKILQVYKDVFPEVRGGIERYIHDLSVFCSSRGHEVEVLVAGGGNRKLGDIRITGVPCAARLLSNPIAPGYRKALINADADVVHFHLPLPTAVTAWQLIPSRLRIPYVVTYHSDIVRQAFLMPFYGPVLSKFLRKAHSVVSTSENYRISSRYLRDLKNTEVIPIGVDTGLFRPAVNPSRDYYLFVGRFRSYKGIEVLLRAWELLKPAPELILAGGGAMAESIRVSAKEKDLPVQVREDVTDSELLELYGNARALILPSIRRSEAYGMVQLEAMACSTPVISSDLSTGVSWVNRNGVSGFTFRTGSPEDLAAAVGKFESLPDCGKALQDGARHRAETMFHAETCFRKVEHCLRTAAGK